MIYIYGSEGRDPSDPDGTSADTVLRVYDISYPVELVAHGPLQDEVRLVMRALANGHRTAQKPPCALERRVEA